MNRKKTMMEFDRIAALEASSGYTVHTYPRKEAEQA